MTENPEQIVHTYLAQLAEIRSTGGATGETSFYSALETLLNAVGRTLEPHVTAGWGRIDSTGKVFPGREKITVRTWSSTERETLTAGFGTLGVTPQRGFELFGRAIDVYLNDTNYWRGVPEKVWEFYIGGYQVLKKWLSYREETILGRPLTKDEAREATGMVRRLAAIVLMTDELDANYAAARDDAYSFGESG